MRRDRRGNSADPRYRLNGTRWRNPHHWGGSSRPRADSWPCATHGRDPSASASSGMARRPCGDPASEATSDCARWQHAQRLEHSNGKITRSITRRGSIVRGLTRRRRSDQDVGARRSLPWLRRARARFLRATSRGRRRGRRSRIVGIGRARASAARSYGVVRRVSLNRWRPTRAKATPDPIVKAARLFRDSPTKSCRPRPQGGMPDGANSW